MLERQFRINFERAERERGITGETLLQLLERRLDNAVYRLGLASSRRQARLVVRHGHVKVNDRRVNIPSFQVRPDDVVEIKEKSSRREAIKEMVAVAETRGMPGWLDLDKEKLTGKIVSLPARDDIKLEIKEQYIVELYSK